ncbi:MAG: uridylate kinase [Candidatus Dojkabacteria bacterium]|nr:MAG: uridylate kinase [Candidatus Dojkabacteria bacterium]
MILKNWKVIKIGGSLLSPSDDKQFDFNYAYKFKSLLDTLNFRFSLTTGGGRFTRIIFQKLKDEGLDNKSDLHQVGVSTSNVNNELLRVVFSDVAFPRVLRYKEYDDYVAGNLQIDFENYKYLVAGSSQPGRSNDWNALQMAKALGVNEVIILKDIDGIYSSDPRDNPDAKLQNKITWKQYFDIIGNPTDFEPGGNVPIDIFAAKDAYQLGIKFYILTGKDLENVKKAITGKDFHGTIVY